MGVYMASNSSITTFDGNEGAKILSAAIWPTTLTDLVVKKQLLQVTQVCKENVVICNALFSDD